MLSEKQIDAIRQNVFLFYSVLILISVEMLSEIELKLVNDKFVTVL